MYAFIEFSRNTQRAVCIAMSAVIVTVCLSLGAFGMQSKLHEGYSVTVTQLQ
jgi:chaperonin GroEL (HSP60 family)